MSIYVTRNIMKDIEYDIYSDIQLYQVKSYCQSCHIRAFVNIVKSSVA